MCWPVRKILTPNYEFKHVTRARFLNARASTVKQWMSLILTARQIRLEKWRYFILVRKCNLFYIVLLKRKLCTVHTKESDQNCNKTWILGNNLLQNFRSFRWIWHETILMSYFGTKGLNHYCMWKYVKVHLFKKMSAREPRVQLKDAQDFMTPRFCVLLKKLVARALFIARDHVLTPNT